MKYVQLLLLSSLCFFVSNVFAQTHTVDESAQLIDNITLKTLFANTWQCQDRLVLESEGYWNRTYPFALTISQDNTFTMEDYERSYTGTWDLEGDKIIRFDVPKEKQVQLEGMLMGSFTINKITDDRLFFSKIVTDTDDTAQLFRFLSNSMHEHVQEQLNIPLSERERTAPVQYSEEGQKQSLVMRIMGMDKTREQAELEKMSLEDLISLYKSL